MGIKQTIADIPELVAEWHPTANLPLTPDQVPIDSKLQITWIKSYDDPETGHHDLIWTTAAVNRTKYGSGCPYISGKDVWPGYNDLRSRAPVLAAQWHPTLNGDLTPDNVTYKSGRRVWWIKYHYDPNTGKYFTFVWAATVNDRVSKGVGCPFISKTNSRVWPGFNDLKTRYPAVADQMHPTLNGNLTADQIHCSSTKEVWWYLPFYDEKSGRTFPFVWKDKVCNRTILGSGCPYLTTQRAWPGYNDLKTVNPVLAAQWHPSLNGDLKPDQVLPNSHKKVWWIKYHYDPRTGKYFTFEWQASICYRTKGNGCPALSGYMVVQGFNDLKSRYPEIAAQWHPTLNGNMTPDKVLATSPQKVWWLLHYYDESKDKWFDFVWEAKIVDRTNGGNGCPYLSGRGVWPGYNDLQTLYPEIATQWHPTLNDSLTPDQVTSMNSRKVWWIMHYYDKEKDKWFDFVWEATICNRVLGAGCPYLNGTDVWPGYNDLLSCFPDVAAEWHPTLNGSLTPDRIAKASKTKVWWIHHHIDENGKEWDFVWQSTVDSRTLQGSECPVLSGKMVWPGFNDLATTHPQAVAMWHPEKNGKLKPEDVTAMSGRFVHWIFHYNDPNTGKQFDFEWESPVSVLVLGGCKCLYIYGRSVWPGYNDLRSYNPEAAEDWDKERNHGVDPSTVYYSTPKKYWWKCKTCGHVWLTSVYARAVQRTKCPVCRKKQTYDN